MTSVRFGVKVLDLVTDSFEELLGSLFVDFLARHFVFCLLSFWLEIFGGVHYCICICGGEGRGRADGGVLFLLRKFGGATLCLTIAGVMSY